MGAHRGPSGIPKLKLGIPLTGRRMTSVMGVFVFDGARVCRNGVGTVDAELELGGPRVGHRNAEVGLGGSDEDK